MGLFNPQIREEQAHFVYHENARFWEDLRENKRKSEVRLNLRFWSEWQDLNLRPLPPQPTRISFSSPFCYAKTAFSYSRALLSPCTLVLFMVKDVVKSESEMIVMWSWFRGGRSARKSLRRQKRIAQRVERNTPTNTYGQPSEKRW